MTQRYSTNRVDLSGKAGFYSDATPLVWDDVNEVATKLWPSGKYVICPNMAKELLTKNDKNRNLSRKHVQTIVRFIQEGNYFYTGDSIVLFTNGQIGDGQHRLQAVIDTQIPIITNLISGIDPECFPYIDTNARNRTKANVLEMLYQSNGKSTKYAREIGQTITWFWKYNIGPSAIVGSNGADVCTNDRIIDVITDHPGIEDVIHKVYSTKKTIPFFRPGLSTVLYITSLIDKEASDEFFDGVTTGTMMEANDPRMRLREVFMAHNYKQLDSVEKFCTIINAWNAFYGGRRPKSVRWKRTTKKAGSPPSPVPSIFGVTDGLLTNMSDIDDAQMAA